MERSLLRWLSEVGPRAAGTVVGIGDDAAVLETPAAGPLVMSTDQVVEGVHFVRGPGPAGGGRSRSGGGDLPVEARSASLLDVGRKAIARSLSDLAAMAARPWFSLVSVALPGGLDEAGARSLLAAALDEAARWGAPVAGGDVSETSGPLVAAVTVAGLMEGRRAWTRGGARPGDVLAVTGRLGGSLLGSHLEITPRIAEALAIATATSVDACIDISDGLVVDCWRLAAGAGLGIVLDLASIPVSPAAERMAAACGGKALDHALHDGEDYELLLALGPEGVDHAASVIPAEVGLAVIGRFEEGPPVVRDTAGRCLEIGGHEHLRDRPA